MSDLLIITSYPPKHETHSAKTVGVASYTKTLVEGLMSTSSFDTLTVWAEYFNSPNSYNEDGIQVERIWQRGNLLSLVKLCLLLIKSPQSAIVLSFEGYMFGSLAYSLLLFLTFLICKSLLGKKIFILQHQVVTDFSTLEKNAFKHRLMNALSFFFYHLVLICTTRVIIFEESLAKKLGSHKKLVTIPHFIPQVTHVDKDLARKKLNWNPNHTYVLYFGYLAPYKGIDWLVNHFPKTDTTHLVIAGDINPNHRQNTTITEFVSSVKAVAHEKQMIVTGFVPEEDMNLYFSAADAIILPYTTFMSSSGPLAIAWAHHKPVLMSSILKNYLESSDIKAAFNTVGLPPEAVFFDFTQASLTTTLKNVFSDLGSHQRLAQVIAKSRSLSVVSGKLAQVIANN